MYSRAYANTNPVSNPNTNTDATTDADPESVSKCDACSAGPQPFDPPASWNR